MNVEVYFNLHKKCLSVRHAGRVIAHLDSIVLDDVRFVVQPAGRARVIAEGKKNVHAFVRGTWVEADNLDRLRTLATLDQQATYNPYKYTTFVNRATEAPVHTASRAVIDGRKVSYAA